jgi:hypothetical protein
VREKRDNAIFKRAFAMGDRGSTVYCIGKIEVSDSHVDAVLSGALWLARWADFVEKTAKKNLIMGEVTVLKKVNVR